MLVCMLSGCGSTAPEPAIQEGEFDFSVTYEFNGEEKNLSGVYVCQYSGSEWTLDGGFHRAWEGYVKNGKTDGIEIGTTANGEKVELNLAFYPEYFMGDFVEGDRNIPAPYLSITLVDEEGMRILYEPAEVEAYCGAKIISSEYEEPIQNSFGTEIQ